jgi:small subunit ribosomal protein S10
MTAIGQKIRISLRAFDTRVLDQSTHEIVDAVKRTGAKVCGPVPMPTRIRKYTVNRSPFIDKKSREQFEERNHKRLIDIVEYTQKTLDSLTELDLPAGVHVEIKLT